MIVRVLRMCCLCLFFFQVCVLLLWTIAVLLRSSNDGCVFPTNTINNWFFFVCFFFHVRFPAMGL
ncbi:hypothetical protein BC829DRAFT_293172 [Chytridium lagenaria]|nr:hypothetical protein BC829DRAFT_293172 [Chytridium lagenaria]